MGQDPTPEHITERAAHGDGGAEHRQDSAPRGEREQVGQNRGRRRTVAAFADPDENAGDEEHGEGGGQARGRGGQAPEDDGAPDDEPAREPIGEPAERGRAQHVGD